MVYFTHKISKGGLKMASHYGNLQKVINKNRRFAITPFIPGGFVTPKTLRKLADVADEYKGVLKITSGQRVMITNLKEEDLPTIWEKLDMVPAVKNPYSVKNVEICPANYCKRSKQNSIGLGMKITKAFHGMELPNRTKIVVVGCRNCCCSANGKDITVMGDVNGYTIKAGGSAGFNPRLPDILVEDLDEKKAYSYVQALLITYKEVGQVGEKLGDLIDRIGLDIFKKQILEKFETMI